MKKTNGTNQKTFQIIVHNEFGVEEILTIKWRKQKQIKYIISQELSQMLINVLPQVRDLTNHLKSTFCLEHQNNSQEETLIFY